MSQWRARWRRAALVYWSAAVTLALVTGLFVAGVVGDAEARAARFGVLRRVPVAGRDLAAGALLRAGDIRVVAVPAALLPEGPVARAPAGRTVIVPLTAGEVILASKVAPSGLHGVAALLHSGERALAVPNGAGTPPLSIGDRVDVLSTASDSGDTVVVASGARVLAVDERAIAVAVLPDDAPGVAAALATATVTLALAGR